MSIQERINAQYTMENIEMIRKKDLEFTLGQVEINTEGTS